YRAVSRVRLGAEVEGAQDLLALPGTYPASRYASTALLRGGKVLESNGRFDDAVVAYRRVARDFAASAEAGEALYLLGLSNLLRGAAAEASTAWGQLGASGADADLRALGLLWQGKLESGAGDAGSARAHWQQALD